ncbi:MAG: response regulator transcription factor [Flavobacterium sp.]|nr:response regulator transcription factor [Flavobacterium sp.]
MQKTTLCIIDDHKIVRQGLKDLLEKLGNYHVIAEFENGQDFLDALPLEAPPDLYILDYSMPDSNGIEVLKKLEKLEEEYKVLLLTQHFDEQIINDAYKYGARGFLNKNCTAHDLKFAIDNISKIGYNNISEILKRIKNYEETEPLSDKIILSKRELQFLQLVCDERELTYEQMSEILDLSVKSIEGYRASIFDKFKIKSKVGLVLFSFKHRLTEPFF